MRYPPRTQTKEPSSSTVHSKKTFVFIAYGLWPEKPERSLTRLQMLLVRLWELPFDTESHLSRWLMRYWKRLTRTQGS